MSISPSMEQKFKAILFSEFLKLNLQERKKQMKELASPGFYDQQGRVNGDQLAELKIHFTTLHLYVDPTELEIYSDMQYNFSSKMFKNICAPIYEKLMYLYMKTCTIKNVEFLTFFIAENLIDLDLTNNMIGQIGSMRKIKWKSLVFIALCYNPIRQLEIQRMGMCENFHMLNLENTLQNSVVVDRSLNCIVKFPIRSFAEKISLKLNLDSGNRIKQISVEKALERKLPSLVLREVYYNQQNHEVLLRN